MQKNSDLDVRRLAARMGAALPAYRSFRNSPAWALPSPVAEVPAPVDAEPAAAEASSAMQDAAALPAAPADVGFAVVRTLPMAPAPEVPPPTPRTAPPAGGFPLIEAALAARPAPPPPGGPTLAALRDRLAGTSQPTGY